MEHQSAFVEKSGFFSNLIVMKANFKDANVPIPNLTPSELHHKINFNTARTAWSGLICV